MELDYQAAYSKQSRVYKRGKPKVMYRVKAISETSVEALAESLAEIKPFKAKLGKHPIKWRKKQEGIDMKNLEQPPSEILQEEIKGADEAIKKMQRKWHKKHHVDTQRPRLQEGEYIKELSTTDRIFKGIETYDEVEKYIKNNMKPIHNSLASLEHFAKELYSKLRAPQAQYTQLEDTLMRLEEAFSWDKGLKRRPHSLKVFGSAANGFWNVSSDVDLTLIIPGEISKSQGKYLRKAQRAIMKADIGKCHLISGASVPILKFVDYVNGLKCDLSINGVLAAKNSTLLAAYAEYDERFRIMGYFIKEWAKVNKVLGGNHHLLSSYAYLNMVVHYLQTVKPPVLPYLQTLFLSSEGEIEEWVEYPVRAKNEKMAQKITGDPEAVYTFTA